MRHLPMLWSPLRPVSNCRLGKAVSVGCGVTACGCELADVVLRDGLVHNRSAGRKAGDIVENAVRRVVVGAEYPPVTVADFGSERDLDEAVAGDVGAHLDPSARLGVGRWRSDQDRRVGAWRGRLTASLIDD